jgi:hypothetical protein
MAMRIQVVCPRLGESALVTHCREFRFIRPTLRNPRFMKFFRVPRCSACGSIVGIGRTEVVHVSGGKTLESQVAEWAQQMTGVDFK